MLSNKVRNSRCHVIFYCLICLLKSLMNLCMEYLFIISQCYIDISYPIINIILNCSSESSDYLIILLIKGNVTTCISSLIIYFCYIFNWTKSRAWLPTIPIIKLVIWTISNSTIIYRLFAFGWIISQFLQWEI